jgi:O-antigen/teichoic acid export membrane protein
MSRLKLYMKSITSGYAAMGTNVIYTMATVPLALAYLPKEQFGLWALITQIAGYLTLLDFGMSSSIARFLANCKDSKEDGRYGSILKTGQLVVTLQGLLVALGGLIAAVTLPGMLQIEPSLHGKFTFLVAAQSMLTSINFFCRVVNAPFWCYQRYDIINLTWTCGYPLSFLAMWLGFRMGFGVNSMLLANIVSCLLSATVPIIASIRLGFWPGRGQWGRVSWPLFKELFNFGKDLFLIGVGMQLVSATQLMIITRFMSLEAAAVWVVGTKMFTLAQQIVGRIVDFSMGAFSEMLARNERARLEKRYLEVVGVSVSTAILAAALGAMGNRYFVEFWTGGKISWSVWNDVCLGLALVAASIARAHSEFTILRKEVEVLRYIYLLEGVTFISMAIPLCLWTGYPGIILAALGANLSLSGIYSIRRTALYFGRSPMGLIKMWAKPPILLLVGLISSAIALAPLVSALDPKIRFFVIIGLALILGPLLFWRLGLDAVVQGEVRRVVAQLAKRSQKRQISPLSDL